MTYTKSVVKSVEITKEEAGKLISEVKKYYTNPKKPSALDAYIKWKNGYVQRLFSLDFTPEMVDMTDEQLLEYARNHMPENLHFDVGCSYYY